MRVSIAVFALVWVVQSLAQGSVAQDVYTLKRVFKEGTSRTYTTKAILEPARNENGDAFKLTIERVDTEKCVKVTPEGNAQIESRQVKLVMKYNDMEFPSGDVEPSPEKITVSPRNEVLRIEANNPEDDTGYRLARALAVVYPEKPVAVGESWTYEAKPDAKASLRGGRFETKLLSIETVSGVRCAKLQFRFTEQPFSQDKGSVQSDGTLWLDLASGELVKMTATVSGLTLDFGPTPTSIRIGVTVEYTPGKADYKVGS